MDTQRGLDGRPRPHPPEAVRYPAPDTSQGRSWASRRWARLLPPGADPPFEIAGHRAARRSRCPTNKAGIAGHTIVEPSPSVTKPQRRSGRSSRDGSIQATCASPSQPSSRCDDIIGNIYKAETLFLRGVDPWRPVGEIADLGALVGLAQRLLDANKERSGQITTGSPRRGAETWVYGRAGQPCRRCGTAVRSADQGRDPEGRVTYWCPRCQS